MEGHLVGALRHLAALLEQQKGTAPEERRKWHLHHEDWNSIAEAVVQPPEHVQHLFAIGDRLTEIGQAVGAVFEPREVGDHQACALLDAAEVHGEEDGLVLMVLQEEGGDGRPELGGGCTTLVNESKDLWANSLVEPRDHMGVVL